MVVPGACYVGRSPARRDHKRKVKIPKIKYGIHRISQNFVGILRCSIPGPTRRYSRPRTTPLRSAARGRLRLVVVPEKQETAMELRKISDIIIEIAKQGLSCEKYAHSKVMHALMALAHIAWNRETVSESYTPREQYIGFINQLRLSAKSIRRELVSEDWEAIISRMKAYKRQHSQNDRRVITACGFTERETLQVQWYDGAQQTHQRGK